MCSQIRDLNISNNKVSDTMLAQSISNLKKLRKLDLSFNLLKNGFKLIDTIHHLKGLKTLKVSRNQIVSQLRIDVGRHFRLKELHASHNKIDSLKLERSSTSKQMQ